MKTLVLGLSLAFAMSLFAADVVWEEPYEPQVPTDPPSGPTKLAPRSVKLSAEVISIQLSSDQALAAVMQVKVERVDPSTGSGQGVESLKVELQKNLAIQRDGRTATLSDLRAGTRCQLIGYQRRDGSIEIGRVLLER